MAMSADERCIVSGSWDSTLRIWDRETGKCLNVLEGHAGPVTSMALSASGRLIISGSDDITLRIWGIDYGQCLKVLEGHERPISSVALSADERCIFSGSLDSTLRVWDRETGDCVRVFFLRGLSSVEYHRSHCVIWSGFHDGRVEKYNLENLPINLEERGK